jgi:hypothetical protein
MTVGDVMDGLPYGPAAGAIRRVKLLFAQTVDRRGDIFRQFRDRLNIFSSSSRIDRRSVEFANGKT